MSDPEPQVSYSVKDLLAIQGEALKRIEQKVDEGNRDVTRALGAIEHRVTVLELRPDLEPRVRVLEDARSEGEGEKGLRRYFWAALAAVASAFWWLPDLIHKHG